MDKLKMKEIRRSVRFAEIRNDLDYANSQPNENKLEQDIVYPFNDGDDYYTIEDNKIVWSCWDNISEEFYREDPNRSLFKTKEQAQEYINKLNK